MGIANDGSNFGLSSGSVTLAVPTADPHTSVTLTFRAYVIRTMDGDELFSVSADGTDLINPDAKFSNLGTFSCTDNTTAGCTGIQATNAPAGTVGPSVGLLDFHPLNQGAVGDTFYDLTLTFPHTAANLSIVFSYTGLQDLFDESWGLDKVTVATDSNLTAPVPRSRNRRRSSCWARVWLARQSLAGSAWAASRAKHSRPSLRSTGRGASTPRPMCFWRRLEPRPPAE